MNTNESSDHRALADLLPFYVTGKLALDDVQRIEVALADNEALRHELALVEEEQVATVQANEIFVSKVRWNSRFPQVAEK